MTDDRRERFLGDAVRARAAVILTRREDLICNETKLATGLDLHVHIARDDNPMRLTFGVLLRGVPSPVTATHADHILGPTMGQFVGMKKFTYPVCLFFFTIREEQAFFSWLAEPVINAGVPKLIHHGQARCEELTSERLDRSIDAIVAWYDEVESLLIA